MNEQPVLVQVTVTNSDGTLYRRYVMDHDDHAQRRVLGMQCRNAFEGWQRIETFRVPTISQVEEGLE